MNSYWITLTNLADINAFNSLRERFNKGLDVFHKEGPINKALLDRLGVPQARQIDTTAWR